MQTEITTRMPLLDKDGNIAFPGYAKSLLWQYDRAAIRAPRARIKEWDYYYVGDDRRALCLTIADMGYVGALSATVMDFERPDQITKSSVFLFPMGKLGMPATSERGDVSYRNGKVAFTFLNDGATRRLSGVYPKFGNSGETLTFDVTLTDVPPQSMVIATPFDRKGYFYYNQKINCMRAEGVFSVGDASYAFDPASAMATLDWGRGVWTYDNTWYWGNLQTRLDGVRFGFNIGYGFGNTAAATENMIFYDGKSHKIEDVVFEIPGERDGAPRFTDPWRFTSSDGRLEMTFRPLIDRYEPFDLKVMAMIPHQVFGYFDGTAVLDDGTVLKFHDRLGFAEKVHNKW